MRRFYFRNLKIEAGFCIGEHLLIRTKNKARWYPVVDNGENYIEISFDYLEDEIFKEMEYMEISRCGKFKYNDNLLPCLNLIIKEKETLAKRKGK
jgi:hypothetical protein